MTPTEIKEKVLKGGKLAIERLLERKRRDNSYVVVSENGKVVRLYAKDMKK
jgi:hypothetical protein